MSVIMQEAFNPVIKLTGYQIGQFWHEGPGREKDVGPLRVRASHTPLLVIHESDALMDAFVAVKASGLSMQVVGWRFGFECKKDRYEKCYLGMPRCWAVPHSDLYGLRSLEQWCISHGYPSWPKQASSEPKLSQAEFLF
jgi:hypothetical protein